MRQIEIQTITVKDQVKSIKTYKNIESKIELLIGKKWIRGNKKCNKNVLNVKVGDNVECSYIEEPRETPNSTFNNLVMTFIQKI